MKRFIAIIAFVMASSISYGAEVINLNRDWRFFSNFDASSDEAELVTLPHTWNTDALTGKRDYFRGIGNYMCTIDVPYSWNGKRVYIKFYGAGSEASLFIDNRYVGEHKGSGTAFVFDITDYIKYGNKSVLWVVVNNSQTLDIMPTAAMGSVYGGLYRNVEIIVAEPTHFDITDYASSGVYIEQKSISQEMAEINAVVKINSLSSRDITVDGVIVEGRDTVAMVSSKVKISNSKGEVTMPIKISSPRLWSGTKDPFLYSMNFKLYEDGAIKDSIELQVGLRSVSIDARLGFILNGEPYEVHGVSMYSDRALVGVAASSYQIREDLDLICDMGANFIKVLGMPQSNYFYSECDRRGLLVWSDLPFYGSEYRTDRAFVNRDSFKQNGKTMLTEMIRQNYNHASIAMWGLFHNMTTAGDSPISYIRELNALAKSEDPYRITACSSNQDGDINFITQVVSWSHSFGWRDGMPDDISVWLESFRKQWGGAVSSAVSYGAGASIYHQAETLVKPRYDGGWHPENWQSHLHEKMFPYIEKSQGLIWGWFINYMFDYCAPGRNWGGTSGIDDMGLVSFDRKYPKDAYYFYKANWNKDEPFVYITGRRHDQRQGTKQPIVVYSNAEIVELFVNGYSVGFSDGENGVFSFKDVEFNMGDNTVEARVDGSTDSTIITITSISTLGSGL